MTQPATHILRLLRWGRVLARHGALRIIERGQATPAPVRRLCKLARFGTIQPRTPDYAAAFQAIMAREGLTRRHAAVRKALERGAGDAKALLPGRR